MTTPPDHDDQSGRSAGSSAPDGSGDRVDLSKAAADTDAPAADAPFDPYRYGRPEQPVPPEYAPPGYVPDQAPTGFPPAPGAAGPAQPYPGYPSNQHPQNPYPPNPYPPNPYTPSQYPPPNQYPYGQTPAFGRGPYPVPPGHSSGGNGKATAAMVLGILAIVLCWLSFLDAVFIVPAVVLGIMGLTRSRALGGTGRGQAVAGLVCAGIATVLMIVLTVFVVRAYDRCGGASQANESGFNQCVEKHLFSNRKGS